MGYVLQLLKKPLQHWPFLGAQQGDWVKTVTADTFERPTSAIGTDALIAVIELAAIVEENEVPTPDFDVEKPCENFVPRLCACSLHGATLEDDVSEHLADILRSEWRH